VSLLEHLAVFEQVEGPCSHGMSWLWYDVVSLAGISLSAPLVKCWSCPILCLCCYHLPYCSCHCTITVTCTEGTGLPYP
jgi:hypothetical protein